MSDDKVKYLSERDRQKALVFNELINLLATLILLGISAFIYWLLGLVDAKGGIWVLYFLLIYAWMRGK